MGEWKFGGGGVGLFRGRLDYFLFHDWRLADGYVLYWRLGKRILGFSEECFAVFTVLYVLEYFRDATCVWMACEALWSSSSSPTELNLWLLESSGALMFVPLME